MSSENPPNGAGAPKPTTATVTLGAGEALLKNIQKRLASVDPAAVAAQIEKIRSTSIAASPRGSAKRAASPATAARAKLNREQQKQFNDALLAAAAKLGVKASSKS